VRGIGSGGNVTVSWCRPASMTGRLVSRAAAKTAAWKAARDHDQRLDGPVSLEQARARQSLADALLREQLLALRAKDLLPRIEVDRVWQAERQAIRNYLLATPGRERWAEKLLKASTAGGVPGVESALTTLVR
jgi:hypothetical protein